MNDVVVTGSRFQTELQKMPISILLIDSAALRSSNGNSVAAVIKQEAGVFVRSYGGHGALHSVSLRGMASDYTLVLVDGKRFTTYQIGTVDLGIFSLTDVERIELIRGSNSALFGADAVGGVINIVTKKGTKRPSLDLSHTFGSFGQQSIGVTAGGEAFGIMLHVGGNVESGKNNFPFRYSDGLIDTILNRTGSDYSLTSFSFSATDIEGDKSSTFSFRLSNAERGQPNPVTNQYQDNLARMRDNDIIGQWNVDWKQSEQLLVNTAASVRYNHEHYTDPNIIMEGKPLSSYYLNRMAHLSANMRYASSEMHQWFIGNEMGYGNIQSNEVKSAVRNQFSVFFSSQHQISAPIEFLFFPSVRYDSYNDVGEALCPQLGMNFGLKSLPEIRLRASYGKSYRVPTFNDLYWNVGGNGNIRPERLLSADAGIIVSTDITGKIELEANYFSIITKDKIIWTPGQSNIWTPHNVSAVSSNGFEMRGDAYLFDEILHIRYNHTIVDVIKTSADIANEYSQGKRLRYTPRETASFLLGTAFSGVSVNSIYSFTGFRYLQSDNNPRFILPSFETVDINLSYSLVTGIGVISFKGEINNLMNEEYAFISGYPMPQRNFSFSTQLHIQ
ncbi:MAG: TonB-dependent receptor [Bacteroidetes bacterium]|nr:TonB-dependent receptor [Bacteroidota bacterium]